MALTKYRIAKPCEAAPCGWCRAELGIGTEAIRDTAGGNVACGNACALNLIDRDRERAQARRLRPLPEIGEAILAEDLEEAA